LGGEIVQARVRRRAPAFLAAAVIAGLVLAVFWQVGGHGFVNFDDGYIFSAQSRVPRGLTLEGLRWALTSFHTGNWQPLTWLSHMLDVELFGVSPGWHHRVSALLHLLNAEVLLLALWRLSGALWPSAFAAALFAVHPLHVESVAWASERKDVLSTLFLALALGAYVRFARRPSLPRYLAVAGLFALGLMAKPMLVTLPFLLLALDFWPLGRLAGVGPRRSWKVAGGLRAGPLAEKVPLLALSAASGVVTYLAQSREIGRAHV
jgi:hypothetical protein